MRFSDALCDGKPYSVSYLVKESVGAGILGYRWSRCRNPTVHPFGESMLGDMCVPNRGSRGSLTWVRGSCKVK